MFEPASLWALEACAANSGDGRERETLTAGA
jgi:hypothetical protein